MAGYKLVLTTTDKWMMQDAIKLPPPAFFELGRELIETPIARLTGSPISHNI